MDKLMQNQKSGARTHERSEYVGALADASAMRRRFLSLAIVLSMALPSFAHAAETLPPEGVPARDSIAVDVSGWLPGFNRRDLPIYLVRQLTEIRPKVPGFRTGAPDRPEPNRLEWTFKPHPYAGGSIRSIGMPASILNFGFRRYVTAEARLVVNGRCVASASGDARIRGGAGDTRLKALVAEMTIKLFSSENVSIIPAK